jgi:hypothetical protein
VVHDDLRAVTRSRPVLHDAVVGAAGAAGAGRFCRTLTSNLARSPGLEDYDDISGLARLLGKDLWLRFADLSADISPADRLADLRTMIEQHIRDRTDDGATWLPTLADLLASAAGVKNSVSAECRTKAVTGQAARRLFSWTGPRSPAGTATRTSKGGGQASVGPPPPGPTAGPVRRVGRPPGAPRA